MFVVVIIKYKLCEQSLQDIDRSAIKVINGYYTGRSEGAPIRFILPGESKPVVETFVHSTDELICDECDYLLVCFPEFIK